MHRGEYLVLRDSLLGVQESCLIPFWLGVKKNSDVDLCGQFHMNVTNLMFTAPDVAVHCCDKPTRSMVYRSCSRTVHRVHVYILVSFCWFIYF